MIRVNHIHKQFKRYKKPSDRLKEILLKRAYHQNFVALNNISFTVADGETLGILGKNGAGKSTLLKIITGVILPDAGSIDVTGRVTGLLELGTGFDTELSGLQNIMANGLLIGMSKAQIAACQDAIIEFSELGDFIHEPVRTYSSGMVMRLAFSIAIHAEPACFVVDEALSVGDAHFQQKCMRRIQKFRARGGSIIFVSHDLNAIKMLCDRVIVLDNGQQVASGTPEQAVNHYNQLIADLDEIIVRPQQGYGNKKAEIVAVALTDQHGQEVPLSSGETLHIQVDFKLNAPLDPQQLTIGILIRDRFGQDIFGTNSHYLHTQVPAQANHSSAHYRAEFRLTLELAPGKYTLTVAIHSQENHLDDCYHWQDNIKTFEVAGVQGTMFAGVCRLPTQLHISPQASQGQHNKANKKANKD